MQRLPTKTDLNKVSAGLVGSLLLSAPSRLLALAPCASPGEPERGCGTGTVSLGGVLAGWCSCVCCEVQALQSWLRLAQPLSSGAACPRQAVFWAPSWLFIGCFPCGHSGRWKLLEDHPPCSCHFSLTFSGNYSQPLAFRLFLDKGVR